MRSGGWTNMLLPTGMGKSPAGRGHRDISNQSHLRLEICQDKNIYIQQDCKYTTVESVWDRGVPRTTAQILS